MYSVQQDGLAGLAQLLQQLEVLHVARAYLDHVHVLEQRQVGRLHDLGDDGQPGGLLRLAEQFKALLVQALEGVGRGAGLEGAAPQHPRAAGLHGLGHGDDLLPALHAAGPCDDLEVPPADLRASTVDDGVVLVEFAVGALEGLLDALDGLHDVQRGDQVHVHSAGVADQADDGVVLALGDVQPEAVALQPVRQVLHLVFVHLVLEQYNHRRCSFPCPAADKKRPRSEFYCKAVCRGFPLNPRYSKALYLRVPIK